MLIKTEYQRDGFLFVPSYKGKTITFPLQNLRKEILRDPDWHHLNALEQVYHLGLLMKTGDGYFLHPEDFFELDAEMAEGLPVPHAKASLCVEENGNIGAPQYSISWYVLLRGKNAGRCFRKGCIASAGGYDFLLSREQYRLIGEIEAWQDDRDMESRARFQAKCKYLAQKAGAQLSAFTQQREFLFAEKADVDVVSNGSHSLQITPSLSGIPEEYTADLPEQIREITQTKHGNRRVSIFVPKETKEQYNTISKIPEITDTDVPRFIHNPLAFLPEDITFDADLFSKRVRGLKIKTARAVPYIRTENDGEEGKWFQVDIGVNLSSDDDSDGQDQKLEDTPELRALIQKAAEHGEEYIFYQDTWVKVNPKAYVQLQEAKDRIDQEIRTGASRQKTIPKILDIYQNVDGMEYNETLQKLLEQSYCLDGTQAFSFRGKLKDYQLVGYQFLKNHYESRTGTLLADDMGLGKTVQVISLLAYMLDENQLAPSLLVMPMSLIHNWLSEIRKFLPDARRIYVHQGAQRYRSSDLIKGNDIVMTTYETLARDQALLGKIRWACVICDEAQKVKNFNTLAAGAVKGMNTACRIALTGTPVENRLSELWSIVDFVQPGLLGSYKAFRQTYEAPIEKHDADYNRITEQLVQKISPVFLRRTKESVLADQLPPKTEQSSAISLNPNQDSLYRKMIEEMQQSEENMALATIQKLLMICSHPRLVTKQSLQTATGAQLQQESPKLAWTIKLLQQIRKKKEKAIIFTRYLAMQAILRQVIFEEFKINAQIINGEVKGNRLDLIEDFKNTPGFSVMILSPKAAGVGLNIVAANHVIHYTREWNPAIENQATDRAYRIGQERPVTVYYPVMESSDYVTVEERLDELLSEKRQLMKSVIIPSNLDIKAASFYDLLEN